MTEKRNRQQYWERGASVRQRIETKMGNTFNVEALISILHKMRLSLHWPTTPDYGTGVKYDFWQLLYMESGEYTCQIEGDSPILLRQGQLLICEPGKLRFSYEVETAVASFINIRCASPKLKRMKNRIFTLSEEEQEMVCYILTKGTEIFKRIPENEIYAGQQPLAGTADYQLQAFKNRIELLLISLYEHCDWEEKAFARQNQMNYYEQQMCIIVDYMKAHLGENLSVEDICAYTGFSVSTIKRIFHRQVQCGAIHYFLKLKINESIRLLNETELTITQISEMLGFSSVHYFSKIFKRFMGVSPRRYGEPDTSRPAPEE